MSTSPNKSTQIKPVGQSKAREFIDRAKKNESTPSKSTSNETTNRPVNKSEIPKTGTFAVGPTLTEEPEQSDFTPEDEAALEEEAAEEARQDTEQELPEQQRVEQGQTAQGAKVEQMLEELANSPEVKQGLNSLFWTQVDAAIPTFLLTWLTLHLYIISPRIVGFLLEKLGSIIEALPGFHNLVLQAAKEGLGDDPVQLVARVVRKIKIPLWQKAFVLGIDFGVIFLAVLLTAGYLWIGCKIAPMVVDPFGIVCKYFDGNGAGTVSNGTNYGVGVGNGGNNGGPINIGRWKDLINKYAAQYGLEPCSLQAILEMESGGGDPNAIGHDNHSRSHDPFQSNSPPYYGLDFALPNFSHGIGLTQITIFPEGSRQGGARWPNYPIVNGVKTPARTARSIPEPNPQQEFYTVSDLLDPDTSIRLSAALLSYDLRKNGNDLQAAFGAYNGSGRDGSYANRAMQKYQQCKLTNSQ